MEGGLKLRIHSDRFFFRSKCDKILILYGELYFIKSHILSTERKPILGRLNSYLAKKKNTFKGHFFSRSGQPTKIVFTWSMYHVC